MMRRLSGFLLLLLIFPIVSVSAEAELYSDEALNSYQKLETIVLQHIDAGTVSISDIELIDRLSETPGAADRPDIQSRLSMLRFAAKESISSLQAENNSEMLLSELSLNDKKHKKAAAAKKAKTGVIVSFAGIAAASAIVFVLSTAVSSDYYDSYTAAASGDDAAFYLYWWQEMDKISIASGITAVISAAAAGLLGVVL